MSLINDALKKAQTLHARTPVSTPTFPRATLAPAGTATTPGTTPAQTPPAGTPGVLPQPTSLRKGKSSRAALLVCTVGMVLMLGLGALGYVAYAIFLAASPLDDVAPAAATVQPPLQGVTAPAAVESSVPAPDHLSDAPAVAAASAKSVTPSASPAVSAFPAGSQVNANPDPTAESASTVVEPGTVAPSLEPAVAPAPNGVVTPPPVADEPREHVNSPAPHIQAWVDKINVSGIRAGGQPKVLMNDRLYLPGDIVELQLGLKLTKIQDKVLGFTDPDGNTYEYRF